MDISHGEGRSLYNRILQRRFEYAFEGTLILDRDDGSYYGRTTHNRIVRQKNGIKAIWDPHHLCFMSNARLHDGEKLDLHRPFRLDDFVPGVEEALTRYPIPEKGPHYKGPWPVPPDISEKTGRKLSTQGRPPSAEPAAPISPAPKTDSDENRADYWRQEIRRSFNPGPFDGAPSCS